MVPSPAALGGPWTRSETYGLAAAATPTPGDDEGGEPLQNWSSLIGIVTAIVGNVLIALALNVQRYAHTRLHKERARNRRRARSAMKRAQRGGGQQASSYGTVIRRSTSTNGDGHGDTVNDEDGVADDSRETDPLASSFHSGESTENGADDEAETQSGESTTYLKSPYWWLGQILITLGEMGNFLAYGFAPASIVSPLGVVALISNCLIAPLMFHERFRQRDFWGVVVAVAGVVTVVMSANTQENKLNPHDVWGAITALEFEVYLAVTVLLIIVLAWASPRYGKRTILIDLGLVGLFGGYTALATKGISSMLSSTLWRAFTTPVTYVLIFILLATAIMQIRYVNKALQRFDSTQVIPIQFVMFTLCVILGSAVLYRDFEHTTSKQAGQFVGGCLLTFFGVFLITSGREYDPDHDHDEDALSEDDGFEETIGLSRHASAQPPAADQRSTPASVINSRRSSRLSRGGLPDLAGTRSPDYDSDEPELWTAKDDSTPASVGLDQEPSLIRNPWAAAPGDEMPGTPPGRGVRTRSADTLMRGSAVLSTPTRPNPLAAARDGLLTDQPTTPQSRLTFPSPQASRPGTFISPSPLASTVTTVMKDAFLLGDRRALPERSSMRHIRSRIRASLFFNEDEAGGDDDDGGQEGAGENGSRPPFIFGAAATTTTTPGDDDAAEEDSGRMRSRSLSDTLGDLFKPKKKRRRGEADEDEAEHEYQRQEGRSQAGPSS